MRVYPNCSYDSARVRGHELLTNINIAEEIRLRISENAMSADEVLMRLAAQARGDMGDFWRITDEGEPVLDLRKAKDKTNLLKKLKVKKTTQKIGNKSETIHEVDFDLYDAQAALQMLGKHHDLFIDKIEVKVKKELEKVLDTLEEKLDEDLYNRVLDAIASA